MLALLFMLPVLGFVANIAGLLGGALMALFALAQLRPGDEPAAAAPAVAEGG